MRKPRIKARAHFSETDPEYGDLSLKDDKIANFRINSEKWSSFVAKCPSMKATHTIKRLILIYMQMLNGPYQKTSFLLRRWVLITKDDYEKYIPKKAEKEINHDPFKDL